jgi:hypothetical protein
MILTSELLRHKNQCDCFVITHQSERESEPIGFSLGTVGYHEFDQQKPTVRSDYEHSPSH